MIKLLLFLITLTTSVYALEIVQKPISFSEHRKALTLQYINTHYGLTPDDITITPQVIVVHFTAIPTLQGSFEAFNSEELPSSRKDIAAKSASVNVSVAYLVDRDGTIYQLMPENWMGRHVIGLNYSSIGIENVGKLGNLTEKQAEANIALISYLQHKYSSIGYLIGHSNYRCFEESALWLEKDKSYRTQKEDPGEAFMHKLRSSITGLKKAPCK
ncbi:MAG: peptidoglycan recognition family protein [Helicobacteraceae bacterium]|nr:peptidoglycan recognition family protein [Helicobacteraceae bacterium]